MMTLRLEELEMELARMAHSKQADKAGGGADKSKDTTTKPSTSSSSLSSYQQPSKTKTSAQTAMNDEDKDDLDTRQQFLSQSITQILDEM